MARKVEALDWFRFHPVRWLTSQEVLLMPLAAQGAYIRLLSIQWMDGSLPAEPEAFARLAGATCEADRVAIEGHLLDLFPVSDDGRRRNARLEEERTEKDAARVQAREAGKRSAEARRPFSDASATVEPEPNEDPALVREEANESAASVPLEANENATTVERPLNDRSATVQRVESRELERSPLSADADIPPEGGAEGTAQGKRSGMDPPPPELLEIPGFAKAWADWLAHRRERRLPTYKPIALGKLYDQLKAMPDVVKAIEHSIARNYNGIFPPKNPPPERPKPKSIDQRRAELAKERAARGAE